MKFHFDVSFIGQFCQEQQYINTSQGCSRNFIMMLTLMNSQKLIFGFINDLLIVSAAWLGRMLLSFLIILMPLFALEISSFMWL